ncbi:putative signal peptide protein [Puccinia sorghi]|uniref:Putative signal peptide protein n=1 Tax=Puccinia sorghi TaxID=27349 RepID=A0A0L6V4S2_9BASI|nr:putative signal peptide protein [Puccinia sorghi]
MSQGMPVLYFIHPVSSFFSSISQVCLLPSLKDFVVMSSNNKLLFSNVCFTPFPFFISFHCFQLSAGY